MKRLMFLAVLAAVIASMWGMLAGGGGKAEAAFTITATATGSPTPTVGPCSGYPLNVDFEITPNVNPGCGDGVDEFTTWTFDFTTSSGFASFLYCIDSIPGSLVGSALLTLKLTPKHAL